MSSIFSEAVLSWDGQEYKVKPTMALINRVEQKVSLYSLCVRIANGDPAFSHLSFVVAEFLRSAGALVTDEDVYGELISADPDDLISIRDVVFNATFPQVKKSGKLKPAQPIAAWAASET